jgi:RNA polymerase sigma-70 factor (ECF subfamily)
VAVGSETRSETFTESFRDAEPRLRRALAAAVGLEAGREASAEALAYGWKHWDRIRSMRNPAGYLYRVGRSKARKRSNPSSTVFVPPALSEEPWCEPGLRAALERLSERQRVAVMLMYGFGYSTGEAAALLGVEAGTVHRHAARGMAKLRAALKVGTDD